MNRLAHCLILVVACGCTTGDDAGPTTASHRLTADDPVPHHPAPPDDDAWQAELKAKRAYHIPAGPYVEKIDWKEAAAYHRADASAIPPAVRAKLGETGVPVLVRDQPPFLRSMGIVVRPNWYAARFEAVDVDLHIRGTKAAFEVPGMKIPKAAREAAHDVTVTRTDGIVTVAFRSFGASYSMDLECHGAADDPRCADGQFALGIANTLGIVGGGSL